MVLEGLFGGDDSDIPKPNPVDLDPTTKAFIGKAQERANTSDEAITNEQLKGVNEAANQGYGSDSGFASAEKQRGGLMDPNLISAIRSKYGSMMHQNLTSMSNKVGMNAFQERANRLKFAQNALTAQRQVENQNYQRLIAAVNNENEIKSSVLKSWMGLAGTAAGIAAAGPGSSIAGKFLGAQVGGQVGSGIGGMVGGGSGKLQMLGSGGAPTQNDYMGMGE